MGSPFRSKAFQHENAPCGFFGGALLLLLLYFFDWLNPLERVSFGEVCVLPVEHRIFAFFLALFWNVPVLVVAVVVVAMAIAVPIACR